MLRVIVSTKVILLAVVFLTFAGSTQAADPTVQTSRKIQPQAAQPNPFNAILAGIPAKQRERKWLAMELVASLSSMPVVEFVRYAWWDRYDSNPSRRMMQLLNESEDLRQAREEWHRFWMNQQPSVLSYERLNGAIGP